MRRMPVRDVAVAAACMILLGTTWAAPLRAQTAGGEARGGGIAPERAVRGSSPKQTMAVPVAEDAIGVDGALDEPAWRTAQWFTDFRQKEPEEGAEPSERTEVAFVFDDHALYVGARMFHSDPSALGAELSRRDDIAPRSETLVVSLDTYRDRRTAYSFAVTAAGVRIDWYNAEDTEGSRDETFDPIWEARTRIDDDGWTAEMRIPFSQLRFNERPEQTWGLNVNRWIPTKNEDIYWVYVPRDETGWASRFGTLLGLDGIRQGKRMELMPYVASDARLTSAERLDAADPFSDRTELGARVGADFKMGLGSSLTLNATVNPDFGQVEADPAQVNLTAFETVFDERRPFFTEGAQYLSGNGRMGPTYFYSRRIGAPPHGRAPTPFADAPDQTTILGAAKLGGRAPSGLSIGALAALTGSESASTFDPGTGLYDDWKVEPATGFGVLRLQQEVGGSSSLIGVTMTGVRRGFAGDDPTGLLLNRQAYTGGGDFLLRTDGGAYELNGHAGLSFVEGSPDAIARVQRSSAHYFQRPDAGYVEYDPARTSMLGWSASLQAAKRSGSLLWNVGGWADSPEWELNDVGLLRKADDIQSWANVTWRETDPGPLLRRWSVGLRGESGWNFGGVHKNASAGVNFQATLPNYWRTSFYAGRSFATQSDVLTRGGPLMGVPAFSSLELNLLGSESAKLQWGVGGFWGDRMLADDWALAFYLGFQPSDRLRLHVEPRIQRFTDRRQYYSTLDRGAESAEVTFGRRYAFSTVEQSEVSAQLRVNYSFSPDMSLELWAQPFAASGRFSAFGELREARSYDLRRYGTDGTTIAEVTDPESGERSWLVTDGAESFELPDRDFRSVSFRSNLVLRWELRPGSTLFVVWQRDLSDGSRSSSLARPSDLFDAFGAPGRNVLAVKMSWWLPL
jgi:hypothetical protein